MLGHQHPRRMLTDAPQRDELTDLRRDRVRGTLHGLVAFGPERFEMGCQELRLRPLALESTT